MTEAATRRREIFAERATSDERPIQEHTLCVAGGVTPGDDVPAERVEVTERLRETRECFEERRASRPQAQNAIGDLGAVDPGEHGVLDGCADTGDRGRYLRYPGREPTGREPRQIQAVPVAEKRAVELPRDDAATTP